MRTRFFLAVALAALLSLGSALAAIPTVSGSTPAAEHGDEVTLAGGCFGPNDLVYSWLDPDALTLGSKIVRRAPIGQAQTFTAGWPEGWYALVSTEPAYGNMPYISNVQKHSGTQALRADVFGNNYISNFQYVPDVDSNAGVSEFDEVFVSFWVNLVPIDNGAGGYDPTYSGQFPEPWTMWKALHICNTPLDGADWRSNNDQEGGYYFTFIGAPYTGLTTQINSEFGFQDESRAACPNANCPGVNCDAGCRLVGVPYNDAGLYRGDCREYKASCNYDGDQTTGNQLSDVHVVNNWTRFDVYWKFSSTLGARDASHRIQTFQRYRFQPTDFYWNGNAISHLDTLQLDSGEARIPTTWEAQANRVNFMGFAGFAFNDVSLYYDDLFVQIGPPARVEIGNASRYSTSWIFEIQHPTSWDNTQIVFDLNTGSFAPGQWAYIYVFNADGEHNEFGRPIWIGPEVPGPELPPHKPKNPRFDEGSGG